jgi:hypothetical protein
MAKRMAKPEAAKPAIEASKPEAKKSDLPKIAAVALLAVLVLALAWYFVTSAATTFNPGAGVDADTFKDIFSKADRIFIVMDVRGVTDSNTSTNILQCGVDFAGSSGMGGKNVSYLSLGNDGCVAEDGKHTAEDCFSMLKSGIVIYVKEGSSSSYHSDSMIVGVGPQYSAGSCSIKKV